MDCPKTDCEGKIKSDGECCTVCGEWFSSEYLEGYWEGYTVGRLAGEENVMGKMREIF